MGICNGPKVLAVMPTRACTAACRHCGSFSRPDLDEHLDPELAFDAIREAHALGFALVAFTGGEATLAWGTLLAGIRLAHELSMRTRLVTNAHWASDAEAADATVRALREAGLDELNFSTGDEHARFVPLDNIARAIVAGVAHDYTVQVTVEYREDRAITKATLLAHPLVQALADPKRLEITESPWMPLSPNRTLKYPEGAAVTATNVHARGGCNSILQTYTLQADGQIGTCCGLGMGVIPELFAGEARRGTPFLADAIEDAEGDFLKLWIRYKGPEKILAWAAKHDTSIAWEGMYAHNCQACQRIYRDPRVAAVIAAQHEEVVDEVLETIAFDEAAFPDRVWRRR